MYKVSWISRSLKEGLGEQRLTLQLMISAVVRPHWIEHPHLMPDSTSHRLHLHPFSRGGGERTSRVPLIHPTISHQLAPMSYFNMVSHDPPTIVVSVQGGSKKHADGFKGEPVPCICIYTSMFQRVATLSPRYQPQRQRDKRVLRVDHLGAVPRGCELHVDRRPK